MKAKNNFQIIKTAPQSSQNLLTSFAGLLSFCVAVFFAIKTSYSPVVKVLLIMGITLFPMLCIDLFVDRVYLRKSAGMRSFTNRKSDVQRSFVKMVGVLGSLGFVAFLYWLFPEYHGDFYIPYWEMLKFLSIPFFLLLFPYIYFVDGIMEVPEDSYYYMGKLFLFHKQEFKRDVVVQHCLGWLIKGFFLPLMFVYFSGNINEIGRPHFGTFPDFKSFYDQAYVFIFTIDLGYVCIGYLFSLKLFDSHIRSSEPTVFGWAIALFCYQPFWGRVGPLYISYEDNHAWGAMFEMNSVPYIMWGSAILILLCIYSLSSIGFGYRFSNLTHRGIITNGMYRLSKHPAYISKNLSWWLIAVPFIAGDGDYVLALRQCLMLALLNLVYFLRAKTEERHLSADKAYQDYSEWMKTHGFLARLKKVFF